MAMAGSGAGVGAVPWEAWQQAVKLTGITYTAGTGMGGQVVGPPFAPTILALGPKAPWTSIIASAVSEAKVIDCGMWRCGATGGKNHSSKTAKFTSFGLNNFA